MSISARETYNLDKEWKFLGGDVLENAGNTHADSYQKSKAGGSAGAASVNFDDSEWRILNVPHDWFCETEFSPDNLLSHGYKTRGNCWYRKTIRLDPSIAGRHILLCFDGVAVTSQVYVNGSLVARSFSAYAEFTADITDRVHFGDQLNVIAVYCGGLETEGWWYEGAGIYRHVRLIAKAPAHISHNGLWVKPVKFGCGWKVELETTVGNSGYTGQSCHVEAQIYDGETIVASGISETFICGPDAETVCRQTLKVDDPKLWDVDSPNLYTLKAVLYVDGLSVDDDKTDFGFRTIAADSERGFILNGRPLKLKGTCNHQDHAGVGVAVPDSVQDFRIKRLKEMGTNAYRCSHNMPAREILDACDKYGLVVMDENRRFEARPEVLGHVETMVRRDRNHPCVVMYSLFNEEPLQGSPEGRNIFRRMKSRVLKLDDTRIVTGAMNGGFLNEEGSALEMDMTGINYSIKNFDAFHAKFPTQPFTGSENNSAVTTRGCYKTDRDAHVLGNYDEEVVPWGQTVRETWAAVRGRDYAAGIFIWTGFDYRGEPTPFSWPSVSSQFGIMDTCGFAKDAFYFNKACFTDEPMLHILPHWNWNEGDKIRVMTVTNCDEAELFLNAVSLGRKKSDVCSQCEWTVDYVPGTLSAKAYKEGTEAVTAEVRTAGKPVRVKIVPDRTYILDDGADTVPVNICVCDENGLAVPTASNYIRFAVEGGGAVIGVGNGDPNCHEADNKPERSLYEGWCQALIQSLPGAEHIMVSAYSDGLCADKFNFDIRHVEAPAYIFASLNQQVGGWSMSTSDQSRKPDALSYIADNDMNSFEPVSFGSAYQEGFTSGYRLYRAFAAIPKSVDPLHTKSARLRFKSVACEAIEVYISGKLEFCGSPADNAPVDVAFEIKPEQKFEIRVVLKAVEGKVSGIKNGVMIL